MAYWNGAYQGTSSNLTYFCGGTFGSAAACSATCFLGATSKACCATCADYADCANVLIQRISNVNCVLTLGAVTSGLLPLSASCGSNVVTVCVGRAGYACSSETITKCSNAICIYAKKVNYSCSYWLCNRCNFDVLFAPIVDTVNDCHMEYSTIKKFMGTIIPAKAECWVGTFDSCIGTWNTCYPGIRVS